MSAAFSGDGDDDDSPPFTMIGFRSGAVSMPVGRSLIPDAAFAVSDKPRVEAARGAEDIAPPAQVSQLPAPVATPLPVAEPCVPRVDDVGVLRVRIDACTDVELGIGALKLKVRVASLDVQADTISFMLLSDVVLDIPFDTEVEVRWEDRGSPRVERTVFFGAKLFLRGDSKRIPVYILFRSQDNP